MTSDFFDISSSGKSGNHKKTHPWQPFTMTQSDTPPATKVAPAKAIPPKVKSKPAKSQSSMNSFIKKNASGINDKTIKTTNKEMVRTTKSATTVPETALQDKKYSSSNALVDIEIYIDTGRSDSIDTTEFADYQPYTMATLHSKCHLARNLTSNAKTFDGAIVPSTKCHPVKFWSKILHDCVNKSGKA
jgi:hypothetical protein